MPQGQNRNGMHVYIWSGLKSHGEGQHDYPQFVADWSKILTAHGAVVDGALHCPEQRRSRTHRRRRDLQGRRGLPQRSQKAALDAYVKRGGGLVSFHDSLCGPDPAYFATLVGGAKKHGEVNYTLDAPIPYTVVDKSSPIMKDMSDITITDEAFFTMTWAKDPGPARAGNRQDPANAQRRRPQGRSGAADLDLRTHRPRRPAGSSIRLDAGPHLRQFRERADPEDPAPRHRLGRQEAGRGTGDYVAPPRPVRDGAPPASKAK